MYLFLLMLCSLRNDWQIVGAQCVFLHKQKLLNSSVIKGQPSDALCTFTLHTKLPSIH